MTERQLQFRVGMVVVIAGVCAAVMILQFGEFGAFWRKPVTVAVHFSSATGVQPGGPVEMNGVTIGSVRNVSIDRRRRGARVVVDLDPKFDIRTDARPRLVRWNSPPAGGDGRSVPVTGSTATSRSIPCR